MSSSITRLPHETDEELRIRVKKHKTGIQATRNLKRLLIAFGIKSAHSLPGLRVYTSFINTNIPGVY